jgi:hypothetical protein
LSAAFQENRKDLKIGSKELRNNNEIVLEAVIQDNSSIEFADLNLQNDKEII